MRRQALDGEVEGRAERPQIGGGSAALAAQPFGGGVVGRVDQVAGAPGGDLAVDDGEAEVGEDRSARPGEEDVGRLDVAVHHPGGMGGGERAENAHADPGRLVDRQRMPIADGPFQGRARQSLHDEPGPLLLDDHVVDGDDRGMLEPGGQVGLPERGGVGLLPSDGVEVRREPYLLDRHVTAERLVGGKPDRARPALGEGVEQPVAACQHSSVDPAHPVHYPIADSNIVT